MRDEPGVVKLFDIRQVILLLTRIVVGDKVLERRQGGNREHCRCEAPPTAIENKTRQQLNRRLAGTVRPCPFGVLSREGVTLRMYIPRWTANKEETLRVKSRIMTDQEPPSADGVNSAACTGIATRNHAKHCHSGRNSTSYPGHGTYLLGRPGPARFYPPHRTCQSALLPAACLRTLRSRPPKHCEALGTKFARNLADVLRRGCTHPPLALLAPAILCALPLSPCRPGW